MRGWALAMEQKEITNARYQMVVKANDLIQKSRFKLSLQQQKIVLYLISQIKPEDKDFKLYQFSIANFCRICGINYKSGKTYEELKDSIKGIADRSIWITLPNGKETLLRWIEKPYIDDYSGTIEIRLDKDMKPFLLDLKQKYTQYELIYTLFFKSKYTIRLYEYIKSIHYNDYNPYERVFTVEELKAILGAENYEQTRDFKRWALFPAIDEINYYSDKDIFVEEKREGRKIVGYRFIISTKGLLERLEINRMIEKEMDAEQMSLFDNP